MPAEAKAHLTRSVERAADILLALGEAPGSAGVTEISRRVGLGKGTVHRLLQTLARKGLVSYVPDQQSYGLGGRVLQLGLSVQERLPLRREVRPYLARLRDLTGESTTLYITIRRAIAPIDQAITRQMPKRVLAIGGLGLLHRGAPGKVLLAHEAPQFIDEYLAHVPLARTTERTITDPAVFRAELDRVRERGYATSIEELRSRTNGVAFPLVNGGGQILGAVAVIGPSHRWTEEAILRQVEPCRAALAPLTAALVGVSPLTHN